MVACLGTLAVPVSPSAAAVFVGPAPTGATCGGGKREGIAIPYKWHLWHAVFLSSCGHICYICRLDIASFHEGVFDPGLELSVSGAVEAVKKYPGQCPAIDLLKDGLHSVRVRALFGQFLSSHLLFVDGQED